jgi:hypothetical protein
MRARVKVRALALPAWMKVYSDARSLSDSVTGMGCFMKVLLVSSDHLTPVNIFLAMLVFDIPGLRTGFAELIGIMNLFHVSLPI